MKNLISKDNSLKIFFLFLILIIPWSISDINDSINAEKITSDLAFYEINPCKVSLTEFLLNNINVLYQDHYFLRSDNYSSITCFGKVTGITQVGYNFYISIGTNPLINILLQGTFWTLLISFLAKEKEKLHIKKTVYFNSLFLTAALFCFSFLAEVRYYEKTFYLLDFSQLRSYLILFPIILFVLNNFLEVYLTRSKKIIYLVPFMYLFVGVFNGLNIHFYSLIFVFFGFVSLFSKTINKKFTTSYIIFASIWLVDSVGPDYYFKPDKLRGLSSTMYDLNSTIYWSLYFFLLFNGLIYLYRANLKDFKFQYIYKNSYIVVISILILGYLGSANPFFNFMNYYYFGQQKVGTNNSNPFLLNEWSERLSWRGFFSSAETIGEFFALIAILGVLKLINDRKIRLIESSAIIFSLFGLYLSNNRAAFLSAILLFLFYFSSSQKIGRTKTFVAVVIFISLFAYLIGVDNIQQSLTFSSNSILNQANNYKSGEFGGSALIGLTNSYENKSLFSYFFSLLSFLAFYLNRSELWGIFFSRYNPNFSEFLFGSGPYNFGQIYGEVYIKETDSLLLPHSSVLSYLVFFGLVGLLMLCLIFLFKLIQNKNNLNILGKLLIMFILLNIFKSDSLIYLPSFTFYSLFLYFIIKKNNISLFGYRNQ
tara:strand:+ start:545 stop:2500 length:1956 start_codon:yes stop_codon:yes gene_type:complete